MNKKLVSTERLSTKKVLLHLTIEEIYLHFRRLFFYYFRKKKMLESIKNRKGYCNYKVCGELCCNVFGCSNFDATSKECAITDNKPIFCQITPIDEKDKPMRTKSLCTFYWIKNV